MKVIRNEVVHYTTKSSNRNNDIPNNNDNTNNLLHEKTTRMAIQHREKQINKTKTTS